MAMLGRLQRVADQMEQRLCEVLREFGLHSWKFAVLSTLRLDGAPYEMCLGTIGAHLRVSNSAMPNRVNRLEKAELVQRHDTPDDRRTSSSASPNTTATSPRRVLSAQLATQHAALATLQPAARDRLFHLPGNFDDDLDA